MQIRFKAGEEGLRTILGPLELRILEVLWDSDKPMHTNKQIRLRLSRADHEAALSTISTTTARMVGKGLLERVECGGVAMFRPRYTESMLIDCVIDQVLSTLLISWPDHLETYVEGVSSGVESPLRLVRHVPA